MYMAYSFSNRFNYVDLNTKVVINCYRKKGGRERGNHSVD